MGYEQEAIALQRDIILSLQLRTVPIRTQQAMLKLLYFNLSSHLIDIKLYDQAMIACDLGIELHIRAKSTEFFLKRHPPPCNVMIAMQGGFLSDFFTCQSCQDPL